MLYKNEYNLNQIMHKHISQPSDTTDPKAWVKLHESCQKSCGESYEPYTGYAHCLDTCVAQMHIAAGQSVPLYHTFYHQPEHKLFVPKIISNGGGGNVGL